MITRARQGRARGPVQALGGAFLAVCLGVVACGGPSGGGGCKYESWAGRCRLTSVRISRFVERFPKSFAVVEALYDPQLSGAAFPPPPFRREVMTLAGSEDALIGHLQAHPEIECAVQNPVGDPCAPQMHASVPEFVGAVTDATPTGPVGCAKIEQVGPQPPPAGISMPGPFQFGPSSAAETADVLRLADEAAQALRADPKIECVSIRAKTAPGESFTLANERAQLVRRLIEARGIERQRVTIFEAQAPVHSAAPGEDQPDPAEQRRVHLTIVVYGR